MAEDEYGDFKEVSDEQGPVVTTVDASGIPVRVKMPKKGEFIGTVMQRLGGSRMDVLSTDGKTRNCRVPGRFKRSMWLRSGDFVIIKPWEGDDSKGDVIFQYNPGAVNQLRKRGMIDGLKKEF
ncbi:MAG: translation initiation factor eIF-1A [archaeon]